MRGVQLERRGADKREHGACVVVQVTPPGVDAGSPGISRHQPVTLPSRRGLYLAVGTDRLTLLVWDACPDLPAHHQHDDDAVSGRGLEIIGALAGRW